MNKFQIVVIGLFIAGIVGGVIAFAMFKGNQSSTTLPSITIWGTFPQGAFNQYVTSIGNSTGAPLDVKYVEKDPATFNSNFVNALALGQGPDAILVPADMLLAEQNKLTPIPYTALPQATYFNTYIDEARIYLTNTGIKALPFTIDPMVMYWNRDTFNSAGLATYPSYWDEFVGTGLKPGLVQKLTTKDQNGNIRKTALAMGDFSNITNPREILGTLLLQSGNPVTTTGNNGIISTISSDYTPSPVPAIQFFSQFADPSNANYSWNRGMTNDKTAFLSGTLATYFSFASDLSDIRNKNPNLNFDIAPMPQIRTGGQKSDYARMFGFSLVRTSSKLSAVFQVISILTSATNLQTLSQTMYLPSVRRDVISAGSSDPYITIFNKTALVSKTWLDVDSKQSGQIFGNLVQSFTSGQNDIDQAVNDAGSQYDAILQQAGQ